MSEIENIISRLTAAGVPQIDEKEKQEISKQYDLLTKWKVPVTEAIRTVIQANLKTHGIETKYWQTGGTAPVVTIDGVRADNEWLTLKGKVVQIWENRSDKVCKTGLIGDGSGVIKFTIFAKNADIIPPDFQEGSSYQFENVVSSVWNGQFSVKGNKNTRITPLTEDISVNRRTDTLVGVIIAISKGSGLIKRCPECNRALVKGACGEHGRVEGIFDLRIKAVFSPFGGNELIDLIIGTDATKQVIGLSVEAARDIAMEALDTAVIEDKFQKELVGRYYEVTGAMMQSSSMLVNDIKPLTIMPMVIEDALAEIKGKGGN